MCGRFALFAPASRIAETFGVPGLAGTELRPRYNIAPSQDVLAIFEDDDGARQVDAFKWGLVPSWAKDVKIGYKLTNARSETAAIKPAFRSALKRRRVLIPANGFYEWVREGKSKLPYVIRTQDELMAMAGIWERWQGPDGQVIRSVAILTTGANDLVSKVHDRMPVILPREHYSAWLDRKLEDAEAIQAMLGQFPAARMETYRVAPEVNDARKQGPHLWEPLAPGALEPPAPPVDLPDEA